MGGNQAHDPSGSLTDTLLIDVTIECSDEVIDSDELVDSGAEGSFDVADLWVRDTEDLANGRCYPLVSVTPGKWEVKGAIKLYVRLPCSLRRRLTLC
jgi:hypothetical protein